MKVETAIYKIINSNLPDSIKKSKLYTLGFKQIPSSPNQKKVLKALEDFKDVKLPRT